MHILRPVPVLSSPSPWLGGENQEAAPCPCSVLNVVEHKCAGGHGERECGISGVGHGASARRGTRESAGGRWGAAAPRPPWDIPAPPPSGWGEGLFFSSPFHSFQKSLFLETSASRPARCRLHARTGSPGTAGAAVHRVGLARAGIPRDTLARRDVPPMPVRVRFPGLRVGCGRAPGPRGAAPLGLATEEGAKLPETTSRHSSQRHPGGISRGAWAGLESKASLPAPAGRAASPRSAPRHACRAVLSRAKPCHGHPGKDTGSGATR